MSSLIEQREEILSLFPRVTGSARSLAQVQIVSQLRDAQARLASGSLMLVVCGEFKRGKSSLINALLDAPGLCPVDVDITTNLITTIGWAEEESISVVLGSPGKEEVKQISLAEISLYVTERHNPGNRRGAQRLLILGPFPPLRDGLVLIDTPGIGGLNAEHTAMTYALMLEADAIVFVTDVVDPLTSQELAFVRDRIARYRKRLIVAATKIDTLVDPEASIVETRSSLGTVLEDPERRIEIVPVSSRLKLEYLKSGDVADLAESNFSALEAAIWDGIGQQAGPILLGGAVAALDQAVGDLRLILEKQLAMLQPETQGLAEENLHEIKVARERLKVLQTKNAEWQRELTEGVAELGQNLKYRAEDAYNEARRQLNEDIYNDMLVKQPEKIADGIASRLLILSTDLEAQTRERVASLRDELREQTKLDLRPVDVRAPVGPTAPPQTPVPQEGSAMRKVANIALAVWDVGWSVLFPWNLPRNVSRLVETTKSQRVSPAQIRDSLSHFLTTSQVAVRRDIERVCKDVRKSMLNDINDQIRRDVERCNEIIAGIEAVNGLSTAQGDDRRKAIARELDSLTRLQAQISALQASVAQRPKSAAAALATHE